MKSIDNHMAQCIIKAYPKGYIPHVGEAEYKKIQLEMLPPAGRADYK